MGEKYDIENDNIEDNNEKENKILKNKKEEDNILRIKF